MTRWLVLARKELGEYRASGSGKADRIRANLGAVLWGAIPLVMIWFPALMGDDPAIASLSPTALSFVFLAGYMVASFNGFGAVGEAAGAIAGERENGTLATLLATPLSMAEIFAGKMAATIFIASTRALLTGLSWTVLGWIFLSHPPLWIVPLGFLIIIPATLVPTAVVFLLMWPHTVDQPTRQDAQMKGISRVMLTGYAAFAVPLFAALPIALFAGRSAVMIAVLAGIIYVGLVAALIAWFVARIIRSLRRDRLLVAGMG